MHFSLAAPDPAAEIIEAHVGMIGQQSNRGVGDLFGARSGRMPNGLSCQPGCQMDTVSLFHVSTGPTVKAWEGMVERPNDARILDNRHGTAGPRHARRASGIGGRGILEGPRGAPGSFNAQLPARSGTARRHRKPAQAAMLSALRNGHSSGMRSFPSIALYTCLHH